ncbi:MAG: glycosyltransferase family 39 protein [bacterium]|nr:glycosyltransferase family 39 protein [bacterium]
MTIPDYGITWDEPLYFRAAKSYTDWFGLIFSGDWQTALNSKTIDTYWQHNSQHPPLTKLLAGLTYTITKHWLDDVIAFRLAELFWYLTLLLVVYHVAQSFYGKNVAWVAMLATAVMPRLFADAHLLELDLPLATIWLCTVYAFYRGIDNNKYYVLKTKNHRRLFGFRISDFGFNRPVIWSLICGLGFGFALLTKVIAVFVIIPLFVWAQIFHRNKYTNNLFCMFTIGPIIFILFWPWLWNNTFIRILDYFAFFFLMESPLKTFYLGHAYASTPWHYPLVLTLTTVPIGILLLALYGILRSFVSHCYPAFKGITVFPRCLMSFLRGKNPNIKYIVFQHHAFNTLLLFNIGFFLIFFALPGTLVIDGVRYFLPIFPMLAIFAGQGFAEIRSKMLASKTNIAKLTFQFINLIIVVIVFLLPLVSIATYHPYQLSYFNELVGGLKGATKLGFETTYWGEVITQKEIDWLNRNLPFQAKVKILPVYPANHAPVAALSFYPDVVVYYQQRGIIRSDINFFADPPYDYFILISRQGLFTPFDWRLYQEEQPTYRTELFGVQLLGIYKLN